MRGQPFDLSGGNRPRADPGAHDLVTTADNFRWGRSGCRNSPGAGSSNQPWGHREDEVVANSPAIAVVPPRSFSPLLLELPQRRRDGNAEASPGASGLGLNGSFCSAL